MEIKETNTYKIKIDTFEGPFDLLFHLLEKNKINIYDIPIGEITDQYMEYLFSMQQMDLEVTSEFLLMAATLLYIKSRILLPLNNENNQEDEDIDPREELVVRLLEYKKYKEAAADLQTREQEWSKLYYKYPEVLNFEKIKYQIGGSKDKLKQVYLTLLTTNKLKSNLRTQEIQEILQKDKTTVKSKIKHIMNILLREQSFIFTKIFTCTEKSVNEIITAFIALLVIVKSGNALVTQESHKSDIYVENKKRGYTLNGFNRNQRISGRYEKIRRNKKNRKFRHANQFKYRSSATGKRYYYSAK